MIVVCCESINIVQCDVVVRLNCYVGVKQQLSIYLCYVGVKQQLSIYLCYGVVSVHKSSDVDVRVVLCRQAVPQREHHHGDERGVQHALHALPGSRHLHAGDLATGKGVRVLTVLRLYRPASLPSCVFTVHDSRADWF